MSEIARRIYRRTKTTRLGLVESVTLGSVWFLDNGTLRRERGVELRSTPVYTIGDGSFVLLYADRPQPFAKPAMNLCQERAALANDLLNATAKVLAEAA